MPERPIVYHIPVCPFSQRLEILLALKGQPDAIEFRVVDITKPRDPELLLKTRGTTALPVLDLGDGRILKESLVILAYVDATYGQDRVGRNDPFEAAVEQMLIAQAGPFTNAGYSFVMNQERDKRDAHQDTMLNLYRGLNGFLMEHSPTGLFLFENYGLADIVFTSLFQRFWFLEYYEDFQLPDEVDFVRVRDWRDACISQPCAQQVTREEIIKIYYDYALGYGNGAVPKGRNISSCVFEPDWKVRPWPPKEKYSASPSDQELGLLADG